MPTSGDLQPPPDRFFGLVKDQNVIENFGKIILLLGGKNPLLKYSVTD